MTSKENLKAANITFKAACRENTGAHMLDSGGAYGRIYNQPDIQEDEPEMTWERDCSPTINTWAYLDSGWTINRKMQGDWEAWDAEHGGDLNWFESGAEFMRSRGYVLEERGNPYNSENDLNQVFVFEVWNLPDQQDRSDGGIYTQPDTTTVFYIHTGCDVRGGYGRPIFTDPDGEYAGPYDCVAGFYAIEGTDERGMPLSDSALRELDEKWAVGYSSNPFYQLCQDAEEFEWDTLDGLQVWVRLESGERVLVAAEMPYLGA